MKEIRYVVVTDIPGTFLHVDVEEVVHMLLEGTIAELIIEDDYKKLTRVMQYILCNKELTQQAS